MSIDYEAALPHLRVKFAEMGLSFADGTLAQAAAMGITQLAGATVRSRTLRPGSAGGGTVSMTA
ncbi:hypothetical protein [Streptomyces sp. SID14515]|uniref:hypothetical protein n=1 Tax=Streptomyces sp. SID14515 TaxID=2706074 RepID=UPI0013CBD6BC|nr:hypothetical protein [Streptomyces sp. SID14515]NEB39520.1 hypothetical protein [Streptomyces sp. SID14515]